MFFQKVVFNPEAPKMNVGIFFYIYLSCLSLQSGISDNAWLLCHLNPHILINKSHNITTGMEIGDIYDACSMVILRLQNPTIHIWLVEAQTIIL